MSKLKESPTQTIKRFEKELVDEKLKNTILTTMIDISNSQYGTQNRKSILPKHPTHPTRIKHKYV